LIDFGRAEIVPFSTLIEELIDLLTEDAEALGCLPELERARDIVANGNSSIRQRRALEAAQDDGADHAGQMQAVVSHLIEEFQIGL
jgi:carboxylate-amine ligase